MDTATVRIPAEKRDVLKIIAGIERTEGSARNVILPAEATCAGRVLFLENTAGGAEVITVQDDTPATVGTPTQDESIMVWCDGTTWRGIVGASS